MRRQWQFWPARLGFVGPAGPAGHAVRMGHAVCLAIIARGWVRASQGAMALALLVACALGLGLGAAPAAWAQAVQDATSTAAAQPERLALGLIVKLKDTKVNSVVRLPASVRPSDSAQSQRLRMAWAASRKRVSYLVQKPTAYGAQVIHQGHYTTVAEAEAEAAKLRQDPDVEWVVVNQMEKQAAVAQVPSPATGGAYASHVWMKRRSDSGAGPGVAGFRTAWDTLYTWSQTHSLSPVVVAVLDTGKLSHIDLDHYPNTSLGRMVPGYDFVSQVSFSRDGGGLDSDPTDPGDYVLQSEINANPSLYANATTACTAHDSSWHGTSVMSMLTPLVDSTIMGPGALSMLPANIGMVLPVRVGGACGALVSDIVEGMLWAAGVDYQGSPGNNPNPARVINLSFGSPGNCLSTGDADILYRQVIQTLRTKGVLVVSSAGNGNNSGGNGVLGPTRPASCPGVMAVTALRYDGSKAYYANTVDGTQANGYYGLAVAAGDDQASPQQSLNLLTDGGATTATGVALESSCPGGQCLISEGTSFAAPQVAAVAALVLSVAPTLSVDELVNLLLTSATPHQNAPGVSASCSVSTGNCNCTQATCGKGVLDANAAVTAALSATGTFTSSPAVSATYFVPDRLQNTSKGGGGGGAADDASLMALLAAVLVLAAARRVKPRAQA